MDLKSLFLRGIEGDPNYFDTQARAFKTFSKLKSAGGLTDPPEPPSNSCLLTKNKYLQKNKAPLPLSERNLG